MRLSVNLIPFEINTNTYPKLSCDKYMYCLSKLFVMNNGLPVLVFSKLNTNIFKVISRSTLYFYIEFEIEFN